MGGFAAAGVAAAGAIIGVRGTATAIAERIKTKRNVETWKSLLQCMVDGVVMDMLPYGPTAR
jgi:hypothetical protein